MVSALAMLAGIAGLRRKRVGLGLGRVLLLRAGCAAALHSVALLFSCSHLGDGRDLELLGSGRDGSKLLVELGEGSAISFVLLVLGGRLCSSR